MKEESRITYVDLLRILRDYGLSIGLVSFFCAMAMGWLMLQRPIFYTAKGSFRHLDTPSSVTTDKTLLGLLSGSHSNSDGDISELMVSRKILIPLIREMGLQATVNDPFYLNPLKDYSLKLLIDFQMLLGTLPAFYDHPASVQFQDVIYSGEKPLGMKLTILDEEIYALYDSSGQLVYEGLFGIPVELEGLRFTAMLSAPDLIGERTVSVVFQPLQTILEHLEQSIQVKEAKKSKNVYTIQMNDWNRFRAANIVNRLLDAYHQFIIEEAQFYQERQLAYLKKRQDHSNEQLLGFLNTFARQQSAELPESGILDVQKEMDFLILNHLNYRQKVNALNHELQFISEIDPSDPNYYERIASIRAPIPSTQAFIQELNVLRKQRDALAQTVSVATVSETDLEEWNAIDLRSAQEQNSLLNQTRSNLQSELERYGFLIRQVSEPGFEVSTLSGTLTDQVSLEIISRAGKLFLSLKDSANRSAREQERIRKELEKEREFLLSHLLQTETLIREQEEWTMRRLAALQLRLTQLLKREIQVIEDKLFSQMGSFVNNLERDRALTDSEMSTLQKQLAYLPSKWVNEQVLKHNLAINRTIVEEVAKLVESKNISKNLDLLKSAPLDYAYPPIKPVSSFIFVMMIVAALFGGLVASLYAVVVEIHRSLKVSPDILKVHRQSYAGSMHKPKEACLRALTQLGDLDGASCLLMNDPEGVLKEQFVTLCGDDAGEFISSPHSPASAAGEAIAKKHNKVVIWLKGEREDQLRGYFDRASSGKAVIVYLTD